MKTKKQRTPQEDMERIARLEGVPVEAVRQEIERVIRLGFLNADPQVRARWNRMPCQGEMPTPEETIEYLKEELRIRNAGSMVGKKG